jgi:DNA-binding beta-propeller fold protein YncE
LAQAASQGVVYIATNDPKENAVIQYRRGSDGSLTKIKTVRTGGRGGMFDPATSIDPLISQDSLVLSRDGLQLLVVNAGSNELSLLREAYAGLQLASTVPSGGVFPNSVALHGNLVYVLNAKGTPNVTGFTLTAEGLKPISGSKRELPGGMTPVPHDVRFSPDGTRLIVTDEGNNQIVVFRVRNSGLLGKVETHASEGTVPFGFSFGRADTLVVTEAVTSSASSYKLTGATGLEVISSAVPNGQAAACWIAITENGRIGFVSNTASGTISSYRIHRDGSLSLVQAVAATVRKGAPIDFALSSDSEFLHVIDSALGRIFTYSVDGARLIERGRVTGLPTTIRR